MLSVLELDFKQATKREVQVQIEEMQETYKVSLQHLNMLECKLNKGKNTLEEFYMQKNPTATSIDYSCSRF